MFLVYAVSLNAIYEKNIGFFLEQYLGMSTQEINDFIQAKKEREEKDRAEYLIKDAIKQEERLAQYKVDINKLKRELKQLTELPKSGNYTVFYLSSGYGGTEKNYLYIYSHNGKRYIERKGRYSYSDSVQPRKRKNKIDLVPFNKLLTRYNIFIESNSVNF